MANRTTVKSNIQALNVPSVSNADLEDMLNDNLADNVEFIEKTYRPEITPAASTFTIDFNGFDNVIYKFSGGAIHISSISNMSDGQLGYLKLTKTPGLGVTWGAGITDLTPVQADINSESVVYYKIKRVLTLYFVTAFVLIGATNESRKGLTKWASDSQIKAGTDTDSGDALVVRPSLMRDNVVFFTQNSDSRTLFNGTVVAGRAMFIWSKTASPNGWVKVAAPGLTFSY